MDRKSGAEELLDGSLDDRGALVGNLRDLARMNRRFGGVRLTRAAVESLAPGRAPLSVLDVGTGGADIPLALIEHGRSTGRLLRSPASTAGRRSSRLPRSPTRASRRPGSWHSTSPTASGSPTPTRTFDLVHSSLLVHHLEPDAARSALREMGRVSRLGIVLNDLVRNRPAWLGAWLYGHVLTRNRFTRTDAPLSVARAYTIAELTALLAAAGLRVERRFDGFAGHRVAFAARRNGTT